MTDRIDPGPGWRLLKAGEKKPRGYEYKNPVFGWTKGDGVGRRASADGFPCRIRITLRTTKSIATRATVRIAFTDCVVDRVVSSPGGLGRENMDAMVAHFADRVKAYQGTGIVKYIMLEIQREGEP